MKRRLTGCTKLEGNRIQVEEQVTTLVCSGVVQYERSEFRWRDIQDGDFEQLYKINPDAPVLEELKRVNTRVSSSG